MADDDKKDDGNAGGNDAIKLILEKMQKDNEASAKALDERFKALEEKINAGPNGKTDTTTTPSSNEKGEDEKKNEDGGNNDVYTSKDLDGLSVADALDNCEKVERSLTAEYKTQQEAK